LEGRLSESGFGFVPDGDRKLSSEVYPLVEVGYPSLCDEDYTCAESCSTDRDQPEWQHAVRRVLDRKRRDPDSRIEKSPERGVWSFGSDPEPDEAVGVKEARRAETTEYETKTTTRNVSRELRSAVVEAYGKSCLLSDVDHPRLLDVAHVLPWSKYPDKRQNPENMVVLSKLHHAAFDAHLFTLDENLRVRNNPGFSTECDFLKMTLLEREGDRVELPGSASLSPDVLREHNRDVDWL